MNIAWTKNLIEKVSHWGVGEYIICAGARNAPLVKVLSAAEGIRLWNFFDERSAGFFALGRMKSQRRPVAVVTTSGTAVAELLPAVIEAHYSGLPLVIVSADRPRRYRKSGAPQSIEQVGLFSGYVDKSLDYVGGEDTFSDLSLSANAPTHINICYDEPLIDSEVSHFSLFPSVEKLDRQKPWQSLETSDTEVKAFFQKVSRPLVVVAGLEKKDRPLVKEKLLQLQSAVYLEAASGLREDPDLENFRVLGGERALREYANHCDGLIRMGRVPTARIWRDLEGDLKSWPVLSVSDLPFSGLGRKSALPVPLAQLSEINFEARPQKDRAQNSMASLFDRYPKSEPGMIHFLSQLVPRGSAVFIGNSLPIREWDLAASIEDKNLEIHCNRGANGIDGLVSTFLGMSDSESEAWAVVGDLSALYDLNSLWVAAQVRCQKLRIVVVNNSGGMIFHRLFNDRNFENNHTLSFENWAKMFRWNYEKWSQVPSQLNLPDAACILELVPDPEQTHCFWESYNQ